jgi:membrane protein required for colicin V production
MSSVDYLILAILLINGLLSLMRGFIAEVMSLVVWAIAVWVSASFSGLIATQFLSGIEQPAVRMASSYIGLFLLVLMAGGLITWVIRRAIAKSGHSSTDRMFGFAFGFARGLLMVFAAILLAGFTAIPKEKWWHESSLIPYLSMGARAVSAYLPQSVRQYLHFPEAPSVPTPEQDATGTNAEAAAEPPSAQPIPAADQK